MVQQENHKQPLGDGTIDQNDKKQITYCYQRIDGFELPQKYQVLFEIMSRWILIDALSINTTRVLSGPDRFIWSPYL